MRHKLMKFFMGVVPFFAAEGIQMLVVILLSFLYGILSAFNIVSNNPQAAGNASYLFSAIAILVCGIVFFFWYRNLLGKKEKRSFDRGTRFKSMVLIFLLGLGCQFAVSGFMSLIQTYFQEIFKKYAHTMKNLTSGNDILVYLLLILLAPITEELIFRGVILHKLKEEIPFFGANILQAVLFGIYHGNIVQGIYATVLGLLLGYMYYKYRSILAPIFLHIIINASSIIIVLLPNTRSVYEIYLICGILCIAYSTQGIRKISMDNF